MVHRRLAFSVTSCLAVGTLLTAGPLLPLARADATPDAPALAADDHAGRVADNEIDRADNGGFYTPKHNPSRQRSLFWMPLASFVVPGLDQLIEGQWAWGAGYLGTAIGTELMASSYGQLLTTERDTPEYKALSEEDKAYRSGQGELDRKYQLVSQIDFAARSFSAFHAFRTAAETWRPSGAFGFLERTETPIDLMLAPFHFEYLARWTTFVPLSVIAALHVLTMYSVDHPTEGEKVEVERDPFSGSDAFYAGATSYLAGTHEEMLFRGWILPLLMEKWGGRVWANIFTAGVFGAAHLSSQNQLPIPQLALGWHLGFVAQKRGMSLSESIFIHTWWDVVAFATAFQVRPVKDSTKPAAMPVLWLPPFMLDF